MGIGETEACTPPGILLRYLFVWVVFNASRLICMVFVADLIARMLDFSMSAVACRPVTPSEAVETGLLVRLLVT